MQNDREWYSVQEVADYLDCSKRTVFRLIEKGQLQKKKVNGLSFIHYQWVFDMIMSNGTGELSKRDNEQMKYLQRKG